MRGSPLRAFLGTAVCAFLLASLTGCASRVPPRQAPAPPLVVRYSNGPPPEAEPYAGTSACGGCHAAILRFWEGTAHARSLDALAARGRSGEASCLRCHATGYGSRSGYDGRAPADLASVGCESCHGPSAGHAADPRQRRPSGPLRRDCPPCTVNEVCRLCHTPARSPSFTPEGYFDRVICPKQR